MDGVQVLPTPIKSAKDVKDYKQIQLPNGLKALLISDTSFDLKKLEEEEKNNGLGEKGLKKSAAALCIGEILFNRYISIFIMEIPSSCRIQSGKKSITYEF